MMALNDNDEKNLDHSRDIQDSGMDIEDGVREENKKKISSESSTQNMVHYIDVVAIVQDLNV